MHVSSFSRLVRGAPRGTAHGFAHATTRIGLGAAAPVPLALGISSLHQCASLTLNSLTRLVCALLSKILFVDIVECVLVELEGGQALLNSTHQLTRGLARGAGSGVGLAEHLGVVGRRKGRHAAVISHHRDRRPDHGRRRYLRQPRGA